MPDFKTIEGQQQNDFVVQKLENEQIQQGVLSQKDPRTFAVNIANLTLGIIGLLSVLTIMVFWVVALVSIIKRNDLKNPKWMWLLLLFFVSPIGMIAYFFSENRKRLGTASLVIVGLLILILPLWSIIRFVLARP